MKHAFPTIYNKLKPEFKTELNHNAKKYSSAKRLKYTLMSKTKFVYLPHLFRRKINTFFF